MIWYFWTKFPKKSEKNLGKIREKIRACFVIFSGAKEVKKTVLHAINVNRLSVLTDANIGVIRETLERQIQPKEKKPCYKVETCLQIFLNLH